MVDEDKIIFADAKDLFQFAAHDFSQRAISTVHEKGIFLVVLAGGNTPKLFFDTITQLGCQKQIPWPCIQFFFTDERYVPADNPENNYHMAQEYLFSKVSVNPENIFRIPTETSDPQTAAKQYDHLLRQVFHLNEHAFPEFDLVYLGLGDDAHTASLMPFTDVVNDAKNDSQLTAALFVPKLNMSRITLTASAINHAKNIIFMVTGASKAEAVHDVLEGPADPQRYPAQLIQSISGKTLWYLDQAAATQLA